MAVEIVRWAAMGLCVGFLTIALGLAFFIWCDFTGAMVQLLAGVDIKRTSCARDVAVGLLLHAAFAACGVLAYFASR
jgi:ABC-type Mn2+/Zn2+ transport system permease subunit